MNRTTGWIFLTAALTVLVGGERSLFSEDTEAKKPASKLLRLTIKGQVFEASPPLSLFGGSMGSSLGDLSRAIRKASSDPGTAGLVLRLRNPAMGWTQMQTLRRELVRFRKSGKHSYCHLDYAGNSAYLLASACTEVSLLPTGMIEIPGLSLGRMYLKGLLDKIGIRFQELRMGRYKSAAEMLTRSGPSDPVREESHALLDELYEEYVDSLAENRCLEPILIRSLVDRALFLPADALASGLVDHLEYSDEFIARITRGEGVERSIVEARLGKKFDLQVGGFAGMMKILNEVFGGPKKARVSTKPKVVILHGSGAIVTGGGQESLFGGAMMTSEEMVRLFRRVREDDSVKAVVFRVDSPGGSALASDLIWREVKLTKEKKPVVVSMGDTAASGGYYVSCAATWIVAERGTLTGSIGVIGAIPDMRELYETIGIQYQVFSRGKRADMISPYGEIKEGGRELLMSTLRKIYDDFIHRVAEGRKLPAEAVASIAEGRVWTGGQALEHGLVDELGGLDQALEKARELAGLPPDTEVLSLPEPKSLFEIIQELEGVNTLLRVAASGLPASARKVLERAEWLRDVPRERIFLALPDVLTVR